MRAHTRLEVHWTRLARNWEAVRRLAPAAEILPMVKADAYGHGLVPVGSYLTRELRARALGVATLGEAEALRAGGVQGPVYVFSETLLDESSAGARYASRDIVPVVHTMEDLRAFLRPAFAHLPLVLKLNSGMNRLGLEESDWETAGRLIKASGRHSIHHLLSHLARSYEALSVGDKTHKQGEAFRRGLALFRGMGLTVDETSLANSGAIEQGFACGETWVRPGLMLYGPPSQVARTEMVSSLVTRVMKAFPVKRGTPVGYGVSVAPEDGVVAVLPLGYGDGFPTQSSGHIVSVGGTSATVFGRVNMDMAFLFFPAGTPVKAGDEVRFWDADPAPLLAWAKHMGTHAYQALCGISPRVPRVYG